MRESAAAVVHGNGSPRAPHSPSDYGGDLFEEDASIEPVATPIWREMMCGLDWLSLRMSPVYYGCGVARGNGQPVMVIPGFMASDTSLLELYWWLTRMGYRAYLSEIGRNADCPNYVEGLLVARVREAYAETGQKVTLIGHSLGGMLARSIATDHPELVAMVMTLGSPFRDSVRAHPAVFATADALRRVETGDTASHIGPLCFSGHCTCGFVRNLLEPPGLTMPHFAVYSRTDGVVDWRSCLDEDAELNDEVASTHIGMAFHPGVYRLIGEHMSEVLN